LKSFSISCRKSPSLVGFFQAREHPYVSLARPQLHAGFVDVQDRARDYLREELAIGRAIVACHQEFELMDLLDANGQSKQLAKHLLQRVQAETVCDVVINGPAHQGM
jgi:hypothetical protein